MQHCSIHPNVCYKQEDRKRLGHANKWPIKDITSPESTFPQLDGRCPPPTTLWQKPFLRKKKMPRTATFARGHRVERFRTPSKPDPRWVFEGSRTGSRTRVSPTASPRDVVANFSASTCDWGRLLTLSTWHMPISGSVMSSAEGEFRPSEGCSLWSNQRVSTAESAPYLGR